MTDNKAGRVIGEVWDEVFTRNEWGRYPGEDIVRFVARNFYAKQRDLIKILEVGCGPGANLWFIAREGFQAYGVDGSAVGIDKCRKRFAEEGLSATLSVGNVTTLGFPDEFFDAVIDVECLAHNSFGDAERIVAEIARVLRPCGVFYSRSFSEKHFVGSAPDQIGGLEFSTIDRGPLVGKGFLRLISRGGIDRLYGTAFYIECLDFVDRSCDGGARLVSEWMISCRKAGR